MVGDLRARLRAGCCHERKRPTVAGGRVYFAWAYADQAAKRGGLEGFNNAANTLGRLGVTQAHMDVHAELLRILPFIALAAVHHDRVNLKVRSVMNSVAEVLSDLL